MLQVGDPGLGKSQILRACSNVAPRSVYVGGNTSTVSGLTVTVTKESEHDYSMEGGEFFALIKSAYDDKPQILP